MARREAVTFLGRDDQKLQVRRRQDNGEEWALNIKEKTVQKDVLNKRFKLSFLAALGRIYTAIDVDLLSKFTNQALKEGDINNHFFISLQKNSNFHNKIFFVILKKFHILNVFAHKFTVENIFSVFEI